MRCSPLLSGTIVTECISRKMEHHHILSFLFVRGLTAILLVGGLGVEDKQKCNHIDFLFAEWDQT
jgi:hypothetical protein